MYANEYQNKARQTAIYPESKWLEYLTLGMVGEAGEFAEKVKKHVRGDYNYHCMKAYAMGELGDVLWYVTMLADEFEVSLEELMESNLRKLHSRKERGKLQGNGDNR